MKIVSSGGCQFDPLLIKRRPNPISIKLNTTVKQPI